MRLLQDDRVSAGNYHRAAPIETFTASANQRHPTDPDEKVTFGCQAGDRAGDR
jgi:hypothetical protein